jgi:hypothetical protein
MAIGTRVWSSAAGEQVVEGVHVKGAGLRIHSNELKGTTVGHAQTGFLEELSLCSVEGRLAVAPVTARKSPEPSITVSLPH